MEDPQNPYAPPATDDRVVTALSARAPMPTSAWAAVLGSAVFTVVAAASNVIGIGLRAESLTAIARDGAIAALVITGIVKGHRLAWQWGRILGAIALLLSMLGVLVDLLALWTRGATDVVPLTLSVLFAACLATVVIALGRPSAYAHFRLICPQCAQRTTTAADFLFNRARCKRCNITF